MSCKTCGEEKYRFFLKCDCCRLQIIPDNQKKWVAYCQLCGKYLCKDCWSNPLKRIIAFGRQFFE